MGLPGCGIGLASLLGGLGTRHFQVVPWAEARACRDRAGLWAALPFSSTFLSTSAALRPQGHLVAGQAAVPCEICSFPATGQRHEYQKDPCPWQGWQGCSQGDCSTGEPCRLGFQEQDVAGGWFMSPFHGIILPGPLCVRMVWPTSCGVGTDLEEPAPSLRDGASQLPKPKALTCPCSLLTSTGVRPATPKSLHTEAGPKGWRMFFRLHSTGPLLLPQG